MQIIVYFSSGVKLVPSGFRNNSFETGYQLTSVLSQGLFSLAPHTLIKGNATSLNIECTICPVTTRIRSLVHFSSQTPKTVALDGYIACTP